MKMKRVNADDYYIQYLKSNFAKQSDTELKKEDANMKDKIQKELKKTFEKDEQKYYCLI